MKSIVRRDTGEDWRSYVIGLMRAEGLVKENEVPSDEEIRRFDKSCKGNKVSKEDWGSGTDSEAKIAKMKDGTTHLAYIAEHFVDLKSRTIIGAEITPADTADTQSLEDSLHKAQIHLEAAKSVNEIRDVAADKGYHSTDTLSFLSEHTSYQTYSPEPKLPGGRNCSKCTRKEHKAVLANRLRAKENKGRKLQRLRSEKVGKMFTHVLDIDPKAVLSDDSSLQPGGRQARAVRNRYLEELAGYHAGGSRLLIVPQNALLCLPTTPQRFLSRIPTIPGRLSTMAVRFSKSEPAYPNHDIFNGLL